MSEWKGEGSWWGCGGLVVVWGGGMSAGEWDVGVGRRWGVRRG